MIDTFKQTIFSGRVGKLKDHQVDLKINPEVRPIAQKERKIPFALRNKVNREIQKLESEGIVEDVTNEPTPWINPLVIVPKSGDEIRLCVDMRCANKAIERTRYPTPTIDEILIKTRGSNIFTKLDLNSAFHQLELSPESRAITTFQTETRIKRFTRLIFGVNSAQEELQHALSDVLRDIDGAINIADDILIYAKSDQLHDEILLRVLTRFQEKGLTLNFNKCIFGQESLNYYGYIFSSQGIKPNPLKLQEIRNTPVPENTKALQSFLGLMNYFKRFIPNYSTLTYPLRQLLRKDNEWNWSPECVDTFTKLKTILTSESCIGYFDENNDTIVYADASPFGVSSILLQKQPGTQDAKIISYSSRALSPAEQKYSQIERECLAIVYACEHNRLYVYGRHFTIYNDHKPIVNTLNNPKSKVPLRIERLTLRLQGYNFDLKHVKGEDNIADYPSRHPYNTHPDQSNVESYIKFVGSLACPNAISLDEIKRETLKDDVLQQVAHLSRTNTWYKLDEITKYPELQKHYATLNSYRRVAKEITVSTDNDILLKDNRIILPEVYQKIAIKLAHSGHMGIVKTKSLLRSKIYFPNIDKMTEEEIRNCLPCQAVGKQNTPAPLNITPTPKHVWEIINTDYLGPLPNGWYLFVLIDQKSKYPEVEFIRNTSADTLIPCLKRIISTFGIPDTIISDNGPPFTSYQLKEFFRHYGINHRRITPRWPQSNGQVERFMKPLMKVIQTAHLERRDWKSAVYDFLFAYRNTPHCTTHIAPSTLIFNRKCRYMIPNFTTNVKQNSATTAEDQIIKSKLQAKNYSDKRRNAQERNIEIGDRVLVKQIRSNKLTPHFQYHPYTIVARNGTMLTATSEIDGRQTTRNISHFKRIPQLLKFPFIAEEEEITFDQVKPPIQTDGDINTNRKQYPKRIRRPIHEWKK